MKYYRLKLLLLLVLLLHLLFHADTALLLLALLLIIDKVPVAKLHRRVVLVKHVLLVESILSQQTLNDLDSLHDCLGKFLLNNLGCLLDLAVGT